MKNIHLLPTDKISRVFITNEDKYGFREHCVPDTIQTCKNHNIYITSNEEIKEGDWFLDIISNTIHQAKQATGVFNTRKKIILTTDQDLIADGVQAIDDEFLEWFVKNPSCKFVEVKSNYRVKSGTIQEHKDGIAGYEYYEYKIIIPQEEPKQETLEEAAEKYIETSYYMNLQPIDFIKFGAKWQAERMYTYDELRQIAYNAYCKGQLDNPTEGEFNLWIQQFKKK
jgi:hypothetical protein